MADVSNGLMCNYTCVKDASLLWLLNKLYLQIIPVITELENKCKKDQHKILFYIHVCNI